MCFHTALGEKGDRAAGTASDLQRLLRLAEDLRSWAMILVLRPAERRFGLRLESRFRVGVLNLSLYGVVMTCRDEPSS